MSCTKLLIAELCFCLAFAGCAIGPIGRSDEQRVVSLIEKIGYERGQQEESFAELEKMGCTVAPLIIKHMDNKRVLKYQAISFKNYGFEGLRHYEVETVIDALDAMLNQITGKVSYNYNYSNATEDDREKAVKGWRNLLNKCSGNLCKCSFVDPGK